MSKPSIRNRRDKYRLRRQLQVQGQRSVFFSSLEARLISLLAWLKVIGLWVWRLLVELVRRSLRVSVIFTLKVVKRFESSKTAPKSTPKTIKLPALKSKLKQRWLRFKQKITKKISSTPVFAWLLLSAICGVVVLAYGAVTRPSSNSINCRAKINGIWQTNLGEINLQEQPNSNRVAAVFSYQNIDRGTVNAKIEGAIEYDTLEYNWTEQAEKGKPKSGGKGIFLFRNKCQEFYGNYGSISLQNRGFQGYMVKAINIK